MQTASLLLVEDNPDDEALVVRSLERFEFIDSIIVARNGREALDLLLGAGSADGKPPLRPSVVFLDIKLRALDGLEVLKAIRNNQATRHLPVVMLTSSDEESDLARAYELGANSYVCKPVSFRELRNTIGILGEYWIRRNRPPPTGSALDASTSG